MSSKTREKALAITFVLLSLVFSFLLAVNIENKMVYGSPSSPSTVGTCTISNAIGVVGDQRKSFYANTRFWVFYSNGTKFVYQSSLDGTSWDSATVVKSDLSSDSGAQIAVFFDDAYVHYVVGQMDTSPYDTFYRRGLPNSNGTVTWTSEVQIHDGDSTHFYSFPVIVVDDAGYVWIGANYRSGSSINCYSQMLKNSMLDGTWVSASGFPYNLSTTTYSTWRIHPVPLTNGKIYACYDYTGSYVWGKLWNGTWGTEETVSDYPISGSCSVSTVSDGDDVHFAYNSNNGGTLSLQHKIRDYDGSPVWEPETIINPSYSVTIPTLSISGSNVYCFWVNITSDHVYYKKYSAGAWDVNSTDWINEESDQIQGNDRIACFYKDYGNYVGIAYITKTAIPHNVRFAYITGSNFEPTIGDFSAPPIVYAGQYVCINATVNDADGQTQITTATVQLSGNVILKWLNTFNTFSIQSDPSHYTTLNQSACSRTILNDTAYLLSWNLRFAWNYSYATPSIIVTNTKVYDLYSSYGSNSKSAFFAFKDDLIVASASVTPVETTPETNVVFSGIVYYYNTTTPPYITGVTVYLELDGLLQGATTTISSSGAWTKTTRCPATTGNKTYVIYSMTDEIGVANKTVALFVMSTGPIGGGYLPSQPTYRPENYTYTPPIYVPEEIAVPTGLEGLGLNLLIIAIVGATILGVGASVVKPSHPTLASKMHVKRASSADYEKRLRRPKRKVKH